MDPTTTWEAMQQELVAGNFDQAAELAEALLTWLGRNGFPPLVGSGDLPDGWHRALAEAGAAYVLNAAEQSGVDESRDR